MLKTIDRYWEAIRLYVAADPDESEEHEEARRQWLSDAAAQMRLTVSRVHRDVAEEMEKQGRMRELPELPELNEYRL